MLRRLARFMVLGALVVLAGANPAVGADPAAGADPADLPAGAQFPSDAEALPAGFRSGAPGLMAAHDGTIAVLGNLPPPARQRGQGVGAVAVALRAADGTWSTAIVDDLRGYRAPRGLPRRLGYYPAAIASGPGGFVAIGRTTHMADCGQRCSVIGDRGWISSLIWHSADGRTWERVDPRQILGSGVSIALEAVTATADGGWLIAGSTASTDFRRPSRLVILSSADGTSWRRTATISGRRALEATAFLDTAAGPVLSGYELVCTRDSSHHSITSYPDGDPMVHTMRQLRLWALDEPAGTRAQGGGGPAPGWSAVDLRPSEVIQAPPVGRLKAADCNVFDSARMARTNGTGQLLGAVGGRLLARTDDGARIATTDDLQTWTVADLPGAVPAGEPTTGQGRVAMAAVEEPGGALAMVSLESRRDPATDEVIGHGHQSIAWRSADGGATWTRLPAGRPLLLGLAESSPADPVWSTLAQAEDGDVLLQELDATSGESQMRLSSPGPLLPWGRCTPGPGADCAFTRLDGDLVGADLTGIDLSGATVGYVDWTDVDLTGADLRWASVAADLSGADLSGVRAGRAGFWSDVDAASLRGADLRGASLPLAAFGADLTDARVQDATVYVPASRPDSVVLADLDLTGVAFYAASAEPGDLRDVDFGTARLDGARFFTMDLTGARLGNTRFDDLYLSGVTCPNGKPMRAATSGAAACGLR